MNHLNDLVCVYGVIVIAVVAAAFGFAGGLATGIAVVWDLKRGRRDLPDG